MKTLTVGTHGGVAEFVRARSARRNKVVCTGKAQVRCRSM